MSIRLLIADSDTYLSDIYESFFRIKGFDVEAVGDGVECLARFRNRTPDVLVLDGELLWGGVNGVLACIREEFPRSPVLTVLIGCRADIDPMQGRDEPLVHASLRKPFRLQVLSDTIRAIVDSSPQ